MDITAFDRREKMLKLREELLAVEEDRLRGEAGYSVGEVVSMMRSAHKGGGTWRNRLSVIQLLYPNARRKCWYLTPLFGTGKPRMRRAFGRFA